MKVSGVKFDLAGDVWRENASAWLVYVKSLNQAYVTNVICSVTVSVLFVCCLKYNEKDVFVENLFILYTVCLK